MADIKVRVGQQSAVKVVSSLGGAQGGSLAELSDVSICLLYTSPSPRDKRQSRMPSSA